MKQFEEKNKGFTLVETLVAITILMLSVTGPLFFVANSMRAAVYARDQITSFYLAQDAFERIRAIRDNNVLQGAGWTDGILAPCNGSNGCYIDPSIGGSMPTICTGTCQSLKVAPTGEYTYSSGSNSQFRRIIKVEETDPGEEIKISVTIEWTTGFFSRSFTAYQFLRNIGS